MAEDHVMVALLPLFTDSMQVPYPHLTLVYAGLASDMSPSSLDGLAKATATIAMLGRPITLRTLVKDVFGIDGSDNNPSVDVIRFHPNLDLIKMRETVVDWNKSEFQFRPHVTVGPKDSWQGQLPGMIAFTKVAFCVGDNHQEFHFADRGFDE